ncbi:hypothetical protein L3X38_033225 [Prunus dulcis]|uniref:Aminotransferase-like plant mobile domain-containing protein n=1 Tax=Prunus dulcis TaxID=3755 RepID=A0AAD4VHW1_PRUDU|nr:hypothetical protein L3X38_033225 [Prunus dulcis]
MRTKHMATKVRTSVEGSRHPNTTVAQGTKGNSSAASSSSKKRTPSKRISGPMGNGVFGVLVFIPRHRNPCSPVLHFDLEEHISFKLTLNKIRGCGNNDICATWYNKAMHDAVKAKVKESGFLPFLSILGHGKKGDKPLLVALAERWWDTTHTFHFDKVGEMTMTPTDFAAITGLRVSGKRLTYDLDIYRNKKKVVKLFGKPIADLLAGERRVPYESLCTPYWRKNPKDDKEADQIARAFILCLIGSSFLNDKSQYVSMHYAPCLEIVSDIGKYDWGGAALACLYRSLDSCSRGRSSSMGGYWRAWEVWACEYLKPLALSRPSGTLNTWPRTLRWVGAKSKRDLQHNLEHFRVMMRHLTNDQVNWNPWGTNESDMPEAVINSVSATRKRILLEGPAGSAWFLGERVAMQSLGTTEPQVPKIPPTTMLSDYKLNDEAEVREALNGYPASEWVANSSNYGHYRDEYIRYRHYEDLREEEGEARNLVGANIRVGNISPQLWSVRIPCWAAENGSKLVRIPRGQDSLDLPLPAGVTHVTTEAATEMLELIAGLNAVLFSTSLEASIEISRLRQEIEVRTKFKADHLGTKGTTKIVIPEEHEEDEEEEEEEEEEEDEEEDEDDGWIDETDVGDEDEQADEDEVGDEDEEADDGGATAKGNLTAEQDSPLQKGKVQQCLRPRTPKRKKTK